MPKKTVNWAVQQEIDDEPTYVVETIGDPGGDHAIEFSASIPVEHRLVAARQVADYLNLEQVKVK